MTAKVINDVKDKELFNTFFEDTKIQYTFIQWIELRTTSNNCLKPLWLILYLQNLRFLNLFTIHLFELKFECMTSAFSFRYKCTFSSVENQNTFITSVYSEVKWGTILAFEV